MKIRIIKVEIFFFLQSGEKKSLEDKKLEQEKNEDVNQRKYWFLLKSFIKALLK